MALKNERTYGIHFLKSYPRQSKAMAGETLFDRDGEPVGRVVGDEICSFCGRKREQSLYLVQGCTGAYICDECAIEAVRLMIGGKNEQ